ncbi:MAG: LysR family transcriptional regulator [Clostridia bacterium]|nr:LysR family transcriptional regulator [Clostridia bacterium]
MELLQIIYFCDAAETQNFSKTAHKFQVPPSNISQSVHRLETELDTEFFKRSANRIVLNEQGKLFYERTKKALALLDEAKKVINDAGNTVGGEIKICVNTNRQIVTQTIEKFREIYPNVSFVLNHDISSVMDFDLIIGDDMIGRNTLKKQLLLEDKIVLAISKDNPLSQKNRIYVEDLRNQRFITMTNHSSLYRHTERICKAMNFVPDIAIQCDDPFYVRKYVALGLGIAFIPYISQRGQFPDNVVFKDAGNYKRKTFVYWNPKSHMTKAVKSFLEALTEEFKTATEKEKLILL